MVLQTTFAAGSTAEERFTQLQQLDAQAGDRVRIALYLLDSQGEKLEKRLFNAENWANPNLWDLAPELITKAYSVKVVYDGDADEPQQWYSVNLLPEPDSGQTGFKVVQKANTPEYAAFLVNERGILLNYIADWSSIMPVTLEQAIEINRLAIAPSEDAKLFERFYGFKELDLNEQG